MNKLSYYGAIDQNIRKFRQVSHALSFLCMKTTFPHCKMKSLSARKCVKLAKSLGWDPKRNWREYPDQWQNRVEYGGNGVMTADIEITFADMGHFLKMPLDDLDIDVSDQYPKVWTEHNQPVDEQDPTGYYVLDDKGNPQFKRFV